MHAAQSTSTQPLVWFHDIKVEEDQDCLLCLESMKGTDNLGHQPQIGKAHVYHRNCLLQNNEVVVKEQREKKENIQELENQVSQLARNTIINRNWEAALLLSYGNNVLDAIRAQKVQELRCPECRVLIDPNSFIPRRDRILKELNLIKSDLIEGGKIGAICGIVSGALFGGTYFQMIARGPIRSEINRVAGTKAGFLMKSLTGIILGIKEAMPYSLSAGTATSIFFKLKEKTMKLDAISLVSVVIASLVAGGFGMMSGSQGFYLGSQVLLKKVFSYSVSSNLSVIAAGIGALASGAISGGVTGAVYGASFRFAARRFI